MSRLNVEMEVLQTLKEILETLREIREEITGTNHILKETVGEGMYE